MATTALMVSEAMRHVYRNVMAGQECVIPIKVRSREERAWRDAVRWLEERKAAEEEWPWPT